MEIVKIFIEEIGDVGASSETNKKPNHDVPTAKYVQRKLASSKNKEATAQQKPEVSQKKAEVDISSMFIGVSTEVSVDTKRVRGQIKRGPKGQEG